MASPFKVRPSHKAVKSYYAALATYADQSVDHEGAVRAHLTPKQQRQLYGLCAEKVREGGKRWRRGWGRRGDTSDGDRGPEKGRGAGRGQGHGRGGRHEQGQAHDPGTERGDGSRDDG